MSLLYRLESDLSAEEFKTVLITSTLSERRPVDDLARLDKMLRKADVIVTARDSALGNKLAGVSRAITDFSYCCYLSDLAVDRAYQGQGVGKKLIEETHQAAGLETSLFLVSAPASETFYSHIKMKSYPCFGKPRSS